jgi:hypothetical protein
MDRDKEREREREKERERERERNERERNERETRSVVRAFLYSTLPSWKRQEYRLLSNAKQNMMRMHA